MPGDSLPTHWPIQTSADTQQKTAPQIGPGEVQFPGLVSGLGFLPVAISAFQVFSISAFAKKNERTQEYSLLLTFPFSGRRTPAAPCAKPVPGFKKTPPPVTLTFSAGCGSCTVGPGRWWKVLVGPGRLRPAVTCDRCFLLVHEMVLAAPPGCDGVSVRRPAAIGTRRAHRFRVDSGIWLLKARR